MKRNSTDDARPEASGGGAVGGGPTGLDPPVRSAIGRELRAMYDEVVSAPVPDRFIKLLEQLEASERDDERRSAGD